MIHIPAAIFQMGTPTAELERLMQRYGIRHADLLAPETPRHAVHLSAFEIARYPVTNAEFAAFVQECPQWQPRRLSRRLHNGDYLKHWPDGRCPARFADHPVVYVTWHAALAYAHWAGRRLPTEAEWEYAARGGLPDAEFPWGDEPPDPSRANYAASGLGATCPVGSYPPNGFRLYDLAGNIWEFCLDRWQADYYAHSPTANPHAGDCWFAGDEYRYVTTRRVIRGGSWGGSPLNLRVAYRDSHPPDGCGPHVGFRCAHSPPRI